MYFHQLKDFYVFTHQADTSADYQKVAAVLSKRKTTYFCSRFSIVRYLKNKDKPLTVGNGQSLKVNFFKFLFLYVRKGFYQLLAYL